MTDWITETQELYTVENNELYCIRKGNAGQEPVLVFLHESLGSAAQWRDFPDMLARACGCGLLVYDRQGYGKAGPMHSIQRPLDYLEQEAFILKRLLEQLNIKEAILFGHSDGASIALIAAALYPQRIRAVISEAAHIYVEEITLQGIQAAKRLYDSSDLKPRLQKYHGDKTDAVFRSWYQTWTSAGFRNWNIEHLLPRIQCPLLVMQGDADAYGTLQQVWDIVKGTGAGAEACIIPGAGHTPHKEAYAETFERSAAFIRKCIE